MATTIPPGGTAAHDASRALRDILERQRELLAWPDDLTTSTGAADAFEPMRWQDMETMWRILDRQMDGLGRKIALDMGAGDLRQSLYATLVCSLQEAHAVEQNPQVYQLATKPVYDLARNHGMADRIHLFDPTDALELEWRRYDLVVLAWTEPVDPSLAEQFRTRIARKLSECPGTVLAVAKKDGRGGDLPLQPFHRQRLSADPDRGVELRLYHADLQSRRAWALGLLREQGFGEEQAATVHALLGDALGQLVTNPYHATRIHDRLVPRLRPSGAAYAFLLETLHARQSAAILGTRLTALGALGGWFAAMWSSSGGHVGSWGLLGGIVAPGAILSAWAIVEHLLIGDLSSAIRRTRDGDGVVVPVRRSTGFPRDVEGDSVFLKNRIRAIVVDAMKDGLA